MTAATILVIAAWAVIGGAELSMATLVCTMLGKQGQWMPTWAWFSAIGSAGTVGLVVLAALVDLPGWL